MHVDDGQDGIVFHMFCTPERCRLGVLGSALARCSRAHMLPQHNTSMTYGNAACLSDLRLGRARIKGRILGVLR